MMRDHLYNNIYIYKITKALLDNNKQRNHVNQLKKLGI
jgi:hypothetical protein